MSREMEESLRLLERDWKIDPVLREFMLQRIPDVSDRRIKRGGVIFHIPYLDKEQKYVLWRCHWPDCHNCCERQGRLPLTSDDLITIGGGLKYKRTSEFIRDETVTTTWEEETPGGSTIMTTINLKRRDGEEEGDDGTRIPCRFLDDKGGCGIHPGRPGVCYLYPFTTWLENDNGMPRVHATYQITGDCPGFYLDEDVQSMEEELAEYSGIIHDYNMRFQRTVREGYGATSFG